MPEREKTSVAPRGIASPFAGRPILLRYGVAVAAVAVAIGVKMAADHFVDRSTPFLLCFTAVLVAGWYGGLGPGLVATFLAAGLADWMWLTQGPRPTAGHTYHFYTGLFLLEGVLVSLVCAAMHLARHRAACSDEDARSSRESLRRKIEELRRSRDYETGMVEEVAEYAIFLLAPDGTVASWNAGGERMFGYREDEIRGKSDVILFTEEDQAKGVPQQEMDEAARDGKASDDRWMRRKDGSHFWASGVTTGLRDDTGTLRGFTKVCRDLTAKKQSDDEREQLLKGAQEARHDADDARAEAVSANRVKDEFLSVVSHELRTPLTAILLWSRLLRAGKVSPAEQAEAIETIERSAKAQQQLIEDLLDVSRIISGKMRLDLRETDLLPVVDAAVDAIRPMAEATGVVVETDLDARAGVVRADPDRLQQVIWNVLTNAVKFTDRGGRIDVRLQRVDDSVRIQVADTGRGIRPEFLPHLFDAFRQAEHATTRQHGGLGLGLAIARQLVQLHGGTIRAESAGEGKGATFTIDLPLAELRREPATIAPTMGTGPGGPRVDGPAEPLRGLRILVVEDENDTRRVLAWMLERAGAEVTAVASAAEAVTAFNSPPPVPRFDMVLSDIGMATENGYDLIRRFRQFESDRGEPAIPAIALTAYAREEDRRRALDAGFQEHLPKPFEPDELLKRIQKLADRRKA